MRVQGPPLPLHHIPSKWQSKGQVVEGESGVPASPLMEGGSGFTLKMVSYRVGETNAQTYVYICTLDNTPLMSKNMDCTKWTLGGGGL